MFNKLVENHVLANLTFVLVMVIGWLAYYQLPREQDPSINFNWVEVWTYWPGSSAADVERRVTEPFEEGLKRIADVKYTSSISREDVSYILVRFSSLGKRAFEDRVADIRRELLARLRELPDDVQQPEIIKLTSANAFPTATLVASSSREGPSLHRHSQKVIEDLERMEGVDRVMAAGARDPELQVEFFPERLIGLGVSPGDLADSISAYFRDLAAGKLAIGDQKWLVRLTGTSSDPSLLGQFPIVTAEGEIPLRAVAEVNSGVEDAQELVRYGGLPAVLFSVSKKEKSNNLELLVRIKAYIEEQNRLASSTGVTLTLLDDQTASTRNAIRVMERNALIGLILVVVSVGVFLGWRTALITSVGIPFVLAGTFIAVMLFGETLNTTVLLAIVISLGMLVDDAVVVVEAIQFHLDRGIKPTKAARLALHEVALPVSTAVFTTIAAFLPLILMPGVLGDFMRVVPVVVSLALLLSLLEAFWMLPSHMANFQPRVSHPGRLQRWRRELIGPLRRLYVSTLIQALRRPRLSLASGVVLLAAAALSISTGAIKVDFFAADFYRLFYVNVDMPPGTNLEKTLAITERVEHAVAANTAGEARGIVSYSGQQITDVEVVLGDERGQVFVSLRAGGETSRTVEEIIESLRESLDGIPGPSRISYVRRKTGPPTRKPISIKVRGSDVGEIREAVTAVKQILNAAPGVSEIADDDFEGANELLLRLNPDAITRAGLAPESVLRALRLFATGEVVASMQHEGEKLGVRLRAKGKTLRDVNEYLKHSISLPAGGEIALGELLLTEHSKTESNIRHQGFRRAITVEAEIDPDVTDTLRANRNVQVAWRKIATSYPGISLDFSGELDDIEESLGAILMLFLLGVGLIYLILGTQFKSYTQPLIVLAAVPMAFVGVVFGLGISGNPLSLFTLYGVVALAGIAANDAIVLISTANRNRDRGGTVPSVVTLAARRRFLPIVITSTTTIAGLFSLAVGWGGQSLMWGPVATAIVWGLAFSTLLTLYVVPVLYMVLVRPIRRSAAHLGGLPLPRAGSDAPQGPVARLVHDLLSRRAGQRQRELDSILQTYELKSLYAEGIEAMRNNDLETPVRCFEQLVIDFPDSLELNILAAQANLRLMQVRGWDIGYSNRASRYVMRARSLGPKDNRVTVLSHTLEEIDESAPQE